MYLQKSCAKYDLLLRLTKYAPCNCMFTWKSEPQSLNCSMYWTKHAILIKFAEYVEWILAC